MPAKTDLLDHERAEEGFTLIELLVYMMLSLIVLVLVAGIFVNSLKAEGTVRTSTEASTAAQLVAQSVGRGARNASDFWHSNPGVTPEILIMRTVGSAATPTWYCEAWSYDSGDLRTMRSTGAIPHTQTSSSVLRWTLLASGAQPLFTSTVAEPVFKVANRQVELKFTVPTAVGQSVLINTSSTSRQPPSTTGAMPSC
ncbi:type II secretion system protein [Cryobacterium sp. TMT1-21]|uniref:PilW family protein n=1 Tax=Cryobacterium sp. TMT1-21 TaxID=1259234 RepID=UPI00106C3BA3|nr:type II secretion system protein [Cryobacterium sp. TMT1-21]TFD15305.1 type II secretion system protein [Cryobacterium sp. TMT1-21]